MTLSTVGQYEVRNLTTGVVSYQFSTNIALIIGY